MATTNFENKQKYYEYGAVGSWEVKDIPEIDPYIHKALQAIDPSLCFVWGGVALIRQSEEDTNPVIVGSRDALKYDKNGRPSPRWFFGKTRRPKYLCYRNKSGALVKIKATTKQLSEKAKRSNRYREMMKWASALNLDKLPTEYIHMLFQVPDKAIPFWEFEYITLGRLRWFLCRRLTASQLVAVGVFTEEDVPRGGDLWVYPDINPLQDEFGRYEEPTLEWVRFMNTSVWKVNNSETQTLWKERFDRELADDIRQEEEEARAEEEEFELFWNTRVPELQKNRVYSI